MDARESQLTQRLRAKNNSSENNFISATKQRSSANSGSNETIASQVEVSKSDVFILRLSAASGPAARPWPSICEDKPNWASPPAACDQWFTRAGNKTH